MSGYPMVCGYEVRFLIYLIRTYMSYILIYIDESYHLIKFINCG